MKINRFEKNYKEGEIYDYEKILAGEDISGSFIHTSFVQTGNVITAIYEYDGYMKVADCHFKSDMQLLNLFEKVLLQVVHACEYFVSIDRIDITLDNIFYRQEDEDVRMAYVLSCGMNFKSSIIRFCRQLRESFEGENTYHIDNLYMFLTEKSYGIDDILEFIENEKLNRN